MYVCAIYASEAKALRESMAVYSDICFDYLEKFFLTLGLEDLFNAAVPFLLHCFSLISETHLRNDVCSMCFLVCLPQHIFENAFIRQALLTKYYFYITIT